MKSLRTATAANRATYHQHKPKKATLKPGTQTWNFGTTIQARYPCSTSRHKLLKGAGVSNRAPQNPQSQ